MCVPPKTHDMHVSYVKSTPRYGIQGKHQGSFLSLQYTALKEQHTAYE